MAAAELVADDILAAVVGSIARPNAAWLLAHEKVLISIKVAKGPVAEARARGAARASVRAGGAGADAASMQFAMEAALAKHMATIHTRLDALEKRD